MTSISSSIQIKRILFLLPRLFAYLFSFQIYLKQIKLLQLLIQAKQLQSNEQQGLLVYFCLNDLSYYQEILLIELFQSTELTKFYICRHIVSEGIPYFSFCFVVRNNSMAILHIKVFSQIFQEKLFSQFLIFFQLISQFFLVTLASS